MASPTGALRLEHPERIAPSSFELASHLDIRPADLVLDLGCGSGLFALEAARRGARTVWATDIDPAAVAETRRNAQANGLTVYTACGDLFEPVRGRRFTLIVANPPQTPFPPGLAHPKSGGPRGLDVFRRIAAEAHHFLVPEGRICFLALSLVPQAELEGLFRPAYDLTRLGESCRDCTRDVYDAIGPGLWEHLRTFDLREEAGRFHFTNRFYLARQAVP